MIKLENLKNGNIAVFKNNEMTKLCIVSIVKGKNVICIFDIDGKLKEYLVNPNFLYEYIENYNNLDKINSLQHLNAILGI